MINIEKLQRDLDELPEEAQELLIDFVELLKKRYSSSNQPETSENNIDDWSDFIGCTEAEPDLSKNYKFYLTKETE
ncbi:hypothetical protein [Cyanothece sp. BG0011]|uniref:hypothetical protein n=1 Tax=Cyanothece sp. BG0011 TaxID=2082950 RepID=UPI000D1E62C6|nr:hypothetical protein [Cyanothece sp. BG0011]